MAGVTVGDGAIIRTRAVVTRLAHTIVGGIPAKTDRETLTEDTIARLQDIR